MEKSFFTQLARVAVRRGALAAVVAFAVLTSVAQAQTLHLITLGNPEGFRSQDAKKAVKKDLENVRNFFVSHVPEDRLNYVNIEKASEHVLFAEINRLDVEEDDVVVFYFTGHAGNQTEDGGHAFQLFQEVSQKPKKQKSKKDKKDKDDEENEDADDGDNEEKNEEKNEEEKEEENEEEVELTETRVLRKDVRQSLSNLSPRLFVILSDCCNAYLPGLTPRSAMPDKDMATPANEISPVAQRLFFEPSGCVDITSSKYGQYSFTDDGQSGSFATTAWLDVFEKVNKKLKKNPKEKIDWNVVSDMMIEETEKRFKKKYPNGHPNGQTTQTPHVYELPGAPRLGVKAATRQSGLYVTEIIKNSPADKSGIKVGDQLIAIIYINSATEIRLLDEGDYTAAIDAAPRTVEITIQREIGKKETLTVELAGRPKPRPADDDNDADANNADGNGDDNDADANNADGNGDVPPQTYDPNLPVFGATVQGQEITNVVAGSAAARAGLEIGDKMLSFNGATIADGYAFERAVDASPLDAKVVVLKKSTNQQVTVDVRLNRDPSQKPASVPGGPVFGATVQGQEITNVVANSPAANAGLQVGDKILSFNGATINDANDYSKAVDASPVEANLVVLKKASNQQTNVVVRLNKTAATQQTQNAPANQTQQTQNAPTNQTQQTPQKAPVFGANFDDQKKILSVVSGSPAEKAGLRVGDQILNFNNTTCSTVQKLSDAIDQAPAVTGGRLLRDGQIVDFNITLNK